MWNLESQLFCSISSTHSRLFGALSVLQFCRVEHHGIRSFLDHVVRDRESIQSWFISLFFWIRFQPRGVRRCNRSLLDSNREDIENIALSELFRITRITPHHPIRGSSPSNLCWMDCSRYSAASRHEVLLDEDDFRSFWRALELGIFLLLSQLHVTILALWSQCLFPRAAWTVVHPRVSLFLFDLRLRFRLCLRLCLQVQQTLAHNSGWILCHPQVSVLDEFLVPSRPNKTSFSISWVNGCSPTGLTVLDNLVLGFGWIRWVSLLLPAFSESNSFIQLSLKEIVGGGRGDTYIVSYKTSPDSITTTFEIQ